jgi:hypothetical protein
MKICPRSWKFTVRPGPKKRFSRGSAEAITALSQSMIEAREYTSVSTLCVGVPELNLTLPLAPGEVYSYDVYTRQDMRGRRIDSAVRSFTYRYFSELEHNKLFMYVHRENLAGLRVAQRLLNPAGSIQYFRSVRSGRILYPHHIHARTFEEFLEEIRSRKEPLPNELLESRDHLCRTEESSTEYFDHPHVASVHWESDADLIELESALD